MLQVLVIHIVLIGNITIIIFLTAFIHNDCFLVEYGVQRKRFRELCCFYLNKTYLTANMALQSRFLEQDVAAITTEKLTYRKNCLGVQISFQTFLQLSDHRFDKFTTEVVIPGI